MVQVLPRGYNKTLPTPPSKWEHEARPYEFREYPKAMNEICTQAHVDAWRKKNSYTDPRQSGLCYNGFPPKIGTLTSCLSTEEDVLAGFAETVGDAVIVQDDEMEAAYRRMHPDTLDGAPEPDVRGGVVTGLKRRPQPASSAELDQMAADNARLAELVAQKRALLAELAEMDAPAAPVAAKPVRAPVVEPKPAVQVEAPKAVEATPAPATGLPTDRDELISVAVSRGVPIDRRWGADKIRKAIEADEG